jgi:hypothetical protein
VKSGAAIRQFFIVQAEAIRACKDIIMSSRSFIKVLSIFAMVATILGTTFEVVTHYDSHPPEAFVPSVPAPGSMNIGSGVQIEIAQNGVYQNSSGSGNCNPNINNASGVTVVCPGGSGTANSQARQSPTECAPDTVFSRERGRCVPIQQYGGVIPCSEDDKSFVNGRWVSNCR